MAGELPDVTEAELAILQVLWDRGSVTIRQITDELHPQGGASRYATVQKLLDRLESKCCVERDRSLFVHRFAAAIDRDTLIGRRLRAVAETLCGGSFTPLLTHLARVKPLSDDERRALRALIDDPEPPAKSQGSRR
jgi:BlaI family transcriptional regulator, penicillinase repressor